MFGICHPLILPRVPKEFLLLFWERLANLTLDLHIHLGQRARSAKDRDKTVVAAVPLDIQTFSDYLTSKHLWNPPKASPASYSPQAALSVCYSIVFAGECFVTRGQPAEQETGTTPRAHLQWSEIKPKPPHCEEWCSVTYASTTITAANALTKTVLPLSRHVLDRI